MPVTLYTTVGCHLCEQAQAWLRMIDPKLEIQLLDVADDDALIDAYGERIPVICYRGRELAWPFGLLEVRGLLLGD